MKTYLRQIYRNNISTSIQGKWQTFSIERPRVCSIRNILARCYILHFHFKLKGFIIHELQTLEKHYGDTKTTDLKKIS